MQNTYLIAIGVANKQKERYYNEYVPDLLDVRNSILSRGRQENGSDCVLEPTRRLGDSSEPDKQNLVACCPA